MSSGVVAYSQTGIVCSLSVAVRGAGRPEQGCRPPTIYSMSAPRGRFGSAAAALVGLVAVSVVAGVMVTVSIAPAIALTGVATTNGIGLFENLPSDLKIDPLQQKTEIYAKNGSKQKLIATFYNQNREIIGWNDVPQTVKNATIAAEDIRYYQHGAVDPTGIVRAAVQDLMHKSQQGASTITQQYVKNVCVQEAELQPTPAKVQAAADVCTGGLSRKVQEARYAIGLEKKYTKDQILLAYLNIVGFGGSIYGIESAAEYYFGVHAKDLTDAQAASLMAIVNVPDDLRIDQKANLPANLARRNYVLTTEHTHNLISDAAFQTAINTPLKPKITPSSSGCNQAGIAGYFCDYVTRIIQQDPAFGATAGERYNNLTSAGWKISTTLDLKLQTTAQKAMNAHVPMKTNIGSTAVTVQVGTGRVLAMVQNKIFNNDGDAGKLGLQYTSVNYNTDSDSGGSSGFQPGSTYKLFTLLDWLKQGHSLNEVVSGNQRTIPESQFTACGAPYPSDAAWSVGNDEGKSENGPTTVRRATALSINGAFASMGLKLDVCDIRDIATAMGVKRADGAKLEDVPPSIIGTNEVTPLSMATAYAGVANNGKTCSPIVIDKVVKTDGTDVAVPQSTCTQGVDKQVAIAAASALRSVITSGTMAGDQTSDGVYEIGKTGTTDDAHDTWAIGSSSKTTTAVWVGTADGPKANLRAIYSFPYCSLVGGSTQAAIARHCIWRDIQTEANALYGGSKTWAQPQSQYIYGAQTTVPNVVGLSQSAATGVLQSSGFTVQVDSAVDSTVAAGLIATQTPGAGAAATPGATVTIAPSSGTAPPGGAAGPTATVPNVVGQSLSNARAALSSAGFTQVGVDYLSRGNFGPCLVTASNPVQGTSAPTSQPVQLAVFGSRGSCGG